MAFEESGGLLDGILAVTHPELYESSQVLMDKIIRHHDQSRAVMPLWPSCFTAVDVIVNRSCPRHRDLTGAPGWHDILLTFGTYHEKAILEL